MVNHLISHAFACVCVFVLSPIYCVCVGVGQHIEITYHTRTPLMSMGSYRLGNICRHVHRQQHLRSKGVMSVWVREENKKCFHSYAVNTQRGAHKLLMESMTWQLIATLYIYIYIWDDDDSFVFVSGRKVNNYFWFEETAGNYICMN